MFSIHFFPLTRANKPSEYLEAEYIYCFLKKFVILWSKIQAKYESTVFNSCSDLSNIVSTHFSNFVKSDADINAILGKDSTPMCTKRAKREHGRKLVQYLISIGKKQCNLVLIV